MASPNVVVQSTYSEHIGVGVAGQVASMLDPRSVMSRIVGRAAALGAGVPTPPIGFGLAVSQGVNDRDVLLGGTLANYIGCTVKDVTLVANAATPVDQYGDHANIGVLRKGEIFVQAKTAVAANGAVFFDAVTGQYQAAGGSGPIPNAAWVTTGNAGDIVAIRFA